MAECPVENPTKSPKHDRYGEIHFYSKSDRIIKTTQLQFKMNAIAKNFLLTGDKFIPELHLGHLKIAYQDLLIALLDYLLNFVKRLKKLKKQMI